MTPRPPQPLPLRVTIASLAVVLAVVSWIDHRAWSGEQRRLYQLLETAGIIARQPAAAVELRRQLDPERAKLAAARLILASELDRSWLLDLPEDERRAAADGGTARLAAARALAASAAERRPASWAAWMLVGATTYLEWSRGGDRRLRTEAERWERPLVTARALAPGQAEPARFLASAYLGDWSRLAPAKRHETAALLAEALRDPPTFDRLIGSWLRLAPSLGAALAVVPDEAWAWDRLQRLFRAGEDWERYAQIRARWHRANAAWVGQQLAQAARRRRGRDPTMARRLYLGAIGRTWPSGRHLLYLDQLLDELPAGPLSSYDRGLLAPWLDWVLETCLARDCPLPAGSIERLARLVEPEAASRLALAAVAAGRLDAAEQLERREARPGDPAWDAFYLLRARRLAGGRPREALASLRRATPEGAFYWQAAAEVAAATGDAESRELAREALARYARRSWSISDWRSGGGTFSLDVWVEDGYDSLSIDFSPTIPAGAVELRWDGDLLGVFPLTPGDRLALSQPFSTGLHRLDLVVLAGHGLGPRGGRFSRTGLSSSVRQSPRRPAG